MADQEYSLNTRPRPAVQFDPIRPRSDQPREQRLLAKKGNAALDHERILGVLTAEGNQLYSRLQEQAVDLFSDTVKHHLDAIDAAEASGDERRANLTRQFGKLMLEDAATNYRNNVQTFGSRVNSLIDSIGRYSPPEPPKKGFLERVLTGPEDD